MLAVTLEDLMNEMDRGKVYEATLRDPLWHLDGLQQGDCVYIDPRPNIILTLLHELIHRRYPRMGEKAVDRVSRKLVCKMSEADLTRWWKAYNRVKIKGRPVAVNLDT